MKMILTWSMKKDLLKYFSIRSLLINALLIYVLMNVSAFLFSDHVIFQPQPSSYKDHPEIIKLTSPDSIILSAFYLPNRQASYTILFSHGNAEDIGDIQRIAMQFRDMGFSVFAYDYRGYGTSGGKPSEAGFYLDIEAAWLYMTERLSIPPDKIILYGRSIGSGPSVELAQRRKVAGVILEAPFMSAYRVATGIPLLLFDKFNNIQKIGNIHAPVLIIHGEKDRLVPIRHGRKLFEKANEPKFHQWIENADHNNIDTADADKYREAITAFAKALGR